jgi:hypothetical protein
VRRLLGPPDLGLWEASGLFWYGGDVLVIGGLFVEIDSYAIAPCAAQVEWGVTRWGLFLMRGVHFFFFIGSIAYGKAGTVVEGPDEHSGSFLMERYLSGPTHVVSEALSKELGSSLSI